MLSRIPRPLAGLLVLLLPALALAAGGSPVPPIATPSGTWRWLQPKPTGANLQDVTFADAQRGFAAGSGSTILRTSDGGQTWEVRPTPSGQDLLAITANQRSVAAVGGVGTILASHDGGDSFSQVGWPASASRPTVVDVQLVDAQNGFAVAADGSLVATTDGFRTVQLRGRVTFVKPRALWFTSPSKGWIVGAGLNNGGVIAQTLDGGRSFSQVFTTASGAYLTATGVSFGGVSVVVVCGASTPRAVVLDESKPNASWQTVDLPGGEITAFSLMPGPAGTKAEFWAAASDAVWGIRDQDPNVQRIAAQTRPRLWSVASPSYGTSYAVGEGGTIIRGVYGGGPGVTIAGNHKESFTSASFPTADGQFGALADNQPGVPRLWVTLNGGASLSLATPAPAPITALAFVDANNGFGFVSSGEFYVTTNGGSTWAPRGGAFTLSVRGTTFLDAQRGYAASDDGLWLTRNAGVNWGRVSLNGGQGRSFTAVAANAAVAAAVTGAGELYKRSVPDFAGPWSAQWPTPSGASLVTVAVFPDGRTAAAGRNANGPWLHLESLVGGPRDIVLPSLPSSLAVSADRLFVLMEGGRLAEVLDDGSVVNEFEAKAGLAGLVARTSVSASGREQPAPIAYGDFGALLVYEDSTPTPPPNQPPVVFLAQPTISLSPGQSAQLDAKAIDPENQPLTYKWSDPNNAGLSFGSPNQPSTQVKWIAPPFPGTKAAARVTVCDPLGACATADVIITAPGGVTGNQPPVAVAFGAVAEPGGIIFLDGSGSTDPDGDPLTFKWTQLSGPPAQIQGPATDALLAASAPNSTGILVFELKVCDPAGACGRIEVTVVVANATQNTPPVAATKGDLAVAPGATFPLDATDSFDPDDGNVASVAWRQASGPTRPIAGPTLALASSTAGANGETYRFIVRVCDSQNSCSEAAMNVTVQGTTPVNQPPKVVVVKPSLTVNVGDRVTLSAQGTDPEGQPVTFAWKDEQPALNLGLAPSGPAETSFTVPPSAAGQTLKFTVNACDPQNACSTATAVVTVNAAPTVLANAGADQTVAGSAVVTLDGSASAGPIAGWAWTQASGAPVTLAGANSSKATFTAPSAAASLVFRLTVTAADGRSATDDVTVTVTGPAIPIANAGPDQRVGYGARVQLDGRRTQDPLNRSLTYAWKSASGLTLTGADAPVATFYAPASDARLAFTLTVCAGPDLCSSDETLVIVQRDGNLPPLPDAGVDRRAQGGATIVLDGTRSLDPEGGLLSAKWTVRQGDGAEIAAPGALWTQVVLPDAAVDTTLIFELEVCDPEKSCATDTVKVDVLANGPEAPSIRAGIVGHDDGNVDEQADFEIRLDVSCPAAACADAGSLRLLSGPPLSRVGTAGWTFHAPTVSRPLPFTFEASVCDVRGRCAATTLDGLVRDTVNEAPVALAGADQEVRRRQLVILDGGATYDPNGESVTVHWKQASGALEVALAAEDVLRPRFTVPADAPLGPLVFELTACDARNACATATTRVTVVAGDPANRAPLAEAGDDLKGPVGAPISLDATRSFDPDGDQLTYRWQVVGDSTATLVDGDKAKALLVVAGPTPKDQPALVELEVCDGFAACSTDRIAVTAYEQPKDDASWDVHFGETTRACGCAGEPASILGLLGLAGLLGRRKSR